MNKTSGVVQIIIPLVLALIVIAGLGYFALSKNRTNSNQVACTLEAKICPDGSSVSRTGPNCEFVPCPTRNKTPNETANWKTYTNYKYGYEVMYPSNHKFTEDKGTTYLETSFETNFRAADDKTPSKSGFSIIVTDNPEELLASDMCKENVKFLAMIYNVECIKDVNPTKKVINKISWEFLQESQISYPPSGWFRYNTVKNKKLYIIYIWSSNNQLVDGVTKTFKFTNQTDTTPTCRPRPACLDSTPRCLIPETEDMCPPTITPSTQPYYCPTNGWIDCMPGPDKPLNFNGCSQNTSPEAIKWYKVNCPDYQGIAY